MGNGVSLLFNCLLKLETCI